MEGDIFTPSTTWPQSCAVAEVKFFRYMARHAWFDSFHLKCLQFSAVVMHLLTAIPLESWRRRYFLLQLDDILQYLCCCMEEKHLDHFLCGNEMVPNEIVLPQAFRMASPPNLFQHLKQDPYAYVEALQKLEVLRDPFMRLLLYGH
ncbi:IPIL1 protein, partial [Anseranas semipalmata]|nr:IPIL1 protein [Anseranas semipalmata]